MYMFFFLIDVFITDVTTSYLHCILTDHFDHAMLELIALPECQISLVLQFTTKDQGYQLMKSSMQ